MRKGVYPYEYMDSLERFKENKLLDSILDLLVNILVMKNINMLKKFGGCLR